MSNWRLVSLITLFLGASNSIEPSLCAYPLDGFLPRFVTGISSKLLTIILWSATILSNLLIASSFK